MPIHMQWRRTRLPWKCLESNPNAPGRAPAIPMVQCSPFQPGLHSHLPSRQVPCSAQRGWQARWSHAAPIQPSSQRQVPPTQTPWPPQSAAQISMEQSCPVQLGSQLQSPVSGRKVPWPEHWSKHVALGVSQLVPPHPTEQWHSPLTQTPLLEHVGSMQSTSSQLSPL